MSPPWTTSSSPTRSWPRSTATPSTPGSTSGSSRASREPARDHHRDGRDAPRVMNELGRLTASELSGIPRGIADIHGAISGRVFRALGPAAVPVRVVHDTIARGTYGAVSGGLWLGGAAAGTAIRLDPETPRGAAVLAALNGLLGDRLEAEGSALAIQMQVRRVGDDPGPDIAVFLHGLGETEYAWGSPSYGDRLEGWTPVFVRFNTGRHISENG